MLKYIYHIFLPTVGEYSIHGAFALSKDVLGSHPNVLLQPFCCGFECDFFKCYYLDGLVAQFTGYWCWYLPQNLSKHVGEFGIEFPNPKVWNVQLPFGDAPEYRRFRNPANHLTWRISHVCNRVGAGFLPFNIFFAWGSRAEAWLSRIAQVGWGGHHPNKYPERQQKTWQSEIILELPLPVTSPKGASWRNLFN